MLIGCDFTINASKGISVSSVRSGSEPLEKKDGKSLFEALLSDSGSESAGKKAGAESKENAPSATKHAPDEEAEEAGDVLGYVEGGLSSSSRLSIPSFMNMVPEGQQPDALVCTDPVDSNSINGSVDPSGFESSYMGATEGGGISKWLSGLLEKALLGDGEVSGTFSSESNGAIGKLRALMKSSGGDIDWKEVESLLGDFDLSEDGSPSLSELSERLGLEVKMEGESLSISGNSPYFALTLAIDEELDEDRSVVGSFSLFLDVDEDAGGDALLERADEADLRKEGLLFLADLIQKEGVDIRISETADDVVASSVPLKEGRSSFLDVSQKVPSSETAQSASEEVSSEKVKVPLPANSPELSGRETTDKDSSPKDGLGASLGSLIDSIGLRAGKEAPVEVLPQRGAPALPQGITNIIRFMQANGETKAQVVVEPPAMGRVEIELHVVPGGMEASMKVDNVAVRDMIRTQMPLLQDLLAEQGISLSGMSVDVRSGDGQRQQWNGESAGNRGLDDGESLDGSEEDASVARIDLEQGLLVWMA
ncbi:flagellar hook-length control protein FliK [Dethiosulfovibrio faecalis]|uniref:flagellar hook-length control protein FliK n=1 Tax=Dethiosulfovibrio faecalis TaxID=2720018 RepID=UPI001F211378|nr:flagellar hook-length control protein FliK [Dethiosulfovibrio faecalis]